MEGFPYAEVFAPIARVGNNIRLIGAGHKKYFSDFFKVLHVEPIQPFIVDFVATAFYGAVIPANGSAGYDTSDYKMGDEMELPDYVLGQYRVQCIDDILLRIGHDAARQILYDTKGVTTYLSKYKPRHTRTERPTVINTEDLIWLVSNNAEAGRRVAQLKKVWLRNEAAAAGEVRFGDGDGTGTDASAANADLSFSVGAGESVAIGEDEIPSVKFFTGITHQVGVQPVRISIEVEEDNLGIFKEAQSAEIFVWEDDVPYIRAINPNETYALPAARILLSGYKMLCERLDVKPTIWTDIPASSMPR